MSGSKIDLKVVLLGKSYAGKTSLVERFIHGRFSGDVVPYQNTIGAAFGAKKITIGKKTVVLGIWDTAGSERYEAMSRIYYRGARGAIVCYDLTDAASFDRAKFWINELKQNEEECKIYLCGTKKDLIVGDRSHRKVDYHTATDYADENMMKDVDAALVEKQHHDTISTRNNTMTPSPGEITPRHHLHEKQHHGTISTRNNTRTPSH